MLRIAVLGAALAVLAAGSGRVTSAVPAPSPTSSPFRLAALTPALSRAGTRRIADIPWLEHVYTTGTGESVDVSVSASYLAGDDIGRRWAAFFASLPHGPELARLKLYVAPLAQLQSICGGSAVGCYGDDQLLLVNEPALGFDPEEVARHEYGHHIARHRLNTPWPALDWGPKHWASAANICRRADSGSAYPGDESLLYHLNPGEAFAETYRVLVDTKLGEADPSWPLVDRSFYPDAHELQAVQEDISTPWTHPTTHAFDLRWGGTSTWEHRVSTPLDGTLDVSVTAPAGVATRLVVLAADGRRPLGVDRLSRGGRLGVTTQICGERAIIVRIAAAGLRGRRIATRVTVP